MSCDPTAWAQELEELIGTVLPIHAVISADPREFFNDFDGKDGYPANGLHYPIWEDTGVVIHLEKAETYQFDIALGRWKRFAESPCRRIFWMSHEGIFGELDDFDYRITEYFPVTSPRIAAEYIALMTGRQLASGSPVADSSVELTTIVDGQYVKFFRYPDDLSPIVGELPWVVSMSLRRVLADEVKIGRRWLNPFLEDFERRELRSQLKSEPPDALKIQMEDGRTISWRKWLLEMSEHRATVEAPLRDALLEIASSLRGRDVLAAKDRWRLQVHTHRYPTDSLDGRQQLDVGVLLGRRVFPDFLSRDVNPAAWNAVRTHVVAPLLAGVDAAPATIPMPSLTNQKRLAFEVKAHRHAVERLSARLAHPEVGTESARELHELMDYRRWQVSDLLERLPKPDAAVERLRSPLPYFLEAPLLAWEQGQFRVQNGLFVSELIVKSIALLGIIEVHARRAFLPALIAPPARVVEGIPDKPSFGHWAQCITWLSQYAQQLPIFGAWIQVLEQQSTRTSAINELRNEHAHPTRTFEREFVDETDRQLTSYIEDTVRALRRATAPEILLLSAQTLGRDESHSFLAKDLRTLNDRFTEREVHLTARDSEKVGVGEIVAQRGASMVSLDAFFRAVSDREGRLVLLCYSKGFNGSTGLFSAVNSEHSTKLRMAESPLSDELWTFKGAPPR